MLETNAWSLGQGAPEPGHPRRAQGLGLPLDQLPPEAPPPLRGDPGAAKRLLAEAGHPGGIKIPVETTAGYGPDCMDAVQVDGCSNWKSAGIEVDLKIKEYGAFVTSAIFGKFDRMIITLRGGTNDPDSYLFRTMCRASR